MATNDNIQRLIEAEAQITKNEARDTPDHWNKTCREVHDILKADGLATSAMAALEHRIMH